MSPDPLDTPRLSAPSLARIGRLQRLVQTLQNPGNDTSGRIGLLHPRQGFGLREIGASGDLSLPTRSEFDLLVIDRPPSQDPCEIDAAALKACLSHRGAILLRKRRRLPAWRCLRREPRRRAGDTQGRAFGGGVDRAEEALRRSGLYVDEIIDTRSREVWLVASSNPFCDTRYRDHIGRVSRDFLRWSIGWTFLPDLPGIAGRVATYPLAR